MERFNRSRLGRNGIFEGEVSSFHEVQIVRIHLTNMIFRVFIP